MSFSFFINVSFFFFLEEWLGFIKRSSVEVIGSEIVVTSVIAELADRPKAIVAAWV